MIDHTLASNYLAHLDGAYRVSDKLLIDLIEKIKQNTEDRTYTPEELSDAVYNSGERVTNDRGGNPITCGGARGTESSAGG